MKSVWCQNNSECRHIKVNMLCYLLVFSTCWKWKLQYKEHVNISKHKMLIKEMYMYLFYDNFILVFNDTSPFKVDLLMKEKNKYKIMSTSIPF